MPSSILSSLGDKVSLTTGKGLQRAEEILLAGRDIFIAEGYAGLSMRAVASRVQVNLSTVQHYYKSKEALVDALLAYVMDDLQYQIEVRLAAMRDSTQYERLVSVLDMFLEETRRPEICAVFLEAWALATRMPFAAQLVAHVQTRERKEFYTHIYGLVPTLTPVECRRRAALIVLQLNGLMFHLPHESDDLLDRKQLEEVVRSNILQLATVA